MKEFNIRAEELLLLGLCRMEFGNVLKIRLRELVRGVTDWKYFSNLANQHGVAALVYHNLEKLGFLSNVTYEAVDFLRNASLMSLARNARNIQMTGEVLNVLNEAGIKTVLLKGMALTMMVYGNGGLRQMSDVDVLIARQDCLKAHRLLVKKGFVSMPVKSVLHRMIIGHIGKHLPSLLKDGFSVELHHELFGWDKNMLTKLFIDDSFESELEGRKVFLPKAQLLFLYLVKHLHSHEMNNESQLRLYSDLVILLEKYKNEILVSNLLVHACQAGIYEILAWKLEHLRDLWDIQFPDWVNEFTDKCHNPDSESKFMFFLRSPKNNPQVNKSDSYRCKLNEITGFHRKVIYVIGDLFPTISFMKKRYNCDSAFKAALYYPHRFGKLVWLLKTPSQSQG